MSINYEHFTFSGGEEQVTVKECGNTFVHRIESSQDLVKLGLIKEALPTDALVSIMIPYFPYARQDRVMNPGEAHALRFVCKYLASLGFYKIFTHDIHSDVAFGMLPNLVNIPRYEALKGPMKDGEFELPWEGADEYDTIISPDGGALKHVYQDAQSLGIDHVVCANKVRDVTTGDITHTEVGCDLKKIQGDKVIITDDICDGGRTFIELAKVLKEDYQVHSVDLYVTHGIFSKGLGALSVYVDRVITTDTRTNPEEYLETSRFQSEDIPSLEKYFTILELIGE